MKTAIYVAGLAIVFAGLIGFAWRLRKAEKKAAPAEQDVTSQGGGGGGPNIQV